MMDGFKTYYVKTQCRHCGKEIILEIQAKVPPFSVFNADGVGEVDKGGEE